MKMKDSNTEEAGEGTGKQEIGNKVNTKKEDFYNEETKGEGSEKKEMDKWMRREVENEGVQAEKINTEQRETEEAEIFASFRQQKNKKADVNDMGEVEPKEDDSEKVELDEVDAEELEVEGDVNEQEQEPQRVLPRRKNQVQRTGATGQGIAGARTAR